MFEAGITFICHALYFIPQPKHCLRQSTKSQHLATSALHLSKNHLLGANKLVYRVLLNRVIYLHLSGALLVLFAHSTWKQKYVRSKGTSERTFCAWKYFWWALIGWLRELIILGSLRGGAERSHNISLLMCKFLFFVINQLYE